MPASIVYHTKGKILVTKGDQIRPGQLIAREKKPDNLISLNLAKHLSVSPKKTLKKLAKKLGQEVKYQEILAVKKGFLGFWQKTIKSPCQGTLHAFQEETGQLIISTAGPLKDFYSGIRGKVLKAEDNIITISVDACEFNLKKAIGHAVEGQIFILKRANENFFDLDEDLSDKIVVGENLTKETLEKTIFLDACAVLTTDIPQGFEIADYQKEKNLLIGQKTEKIFYNIGLVDKEDLEKIKKLSGKLGFFDPENKKLIIYNQ